MRISDWSSDVCSSDLTAHTRWAVRSAPSLPLEANAPGHPAMELELLRQRGRPADGVWHVEWDREQTIFRDRNRDRPALSGAVVPLPVRGPRGSDAVIPFRQHGRATWGESLCQYG